MKVLLLSGGQDSTALAWRERPDLALTIDYGQLPALGEIRASRAVSRALGLRHEVLRVDCRGLGSGDMAGSPPSEIAPSPEWWPFRNQLLLTFAAMRSLQIGAGTVLIGTVQSDGVHADGRVEFLDSINDLLETQEGAVQVVAPALSMTSAELILSSGIPPEILAWSHSCHVSEWACGSCRGCAKQLEVRTALGYEPL
jgi:7-cyano-7-deazaguanine synthase